VLFIRGCKIIERHKTIVPLLDEVGEQLSNYVATFYDSGILKPNLILAPNIIDDSIKNYLNVNIEKPLKGIKKKLVEMANENALISLNEKYELIKRDEERCEGANNELRDILKLEKLERIEIFDNSNLFGEFNVSGMVVFVNGKPSKKDYRKFKITLDVNDDYGTMREVIYRRYFRVLKDNLERPDLIIVDGGVGQIHVAREVIDSLGLDIPVAGLKKDDTHSTNMLLGLEPLTEIMIDKRSNLFMLLTRMQDEVHNFTISYHKNIRSKGALSSILDNIDGIGEVRKNRLLKKYKTITKMKEASTEELEEILPHDTAVKFKEFLDSYE